MGKGFSLKARDRVTWGSRERSGGGGLSRIRRQPLKLKHSQINPVGVLNAERAASNALTGARPFPPRIRPIAETGLRLPR